MRIQAERGFSAPPEVVFNTAIDPDRAAAWLPAQLRTDGAPGAEVRTEDLDVRWRGPEPADWSARLCVSPIDAGGARVRLELATESGLSDQRLRVIADESLASLAREVADNFTAG